MKLTGKKKQNTENRRIAPLFDEFKRQMGCNPNWLPGSLTEQWIKVFWELLLREHANRSPFSSKFVFETLKENCFVVDEWTALDSGRSVNACIQSSIRQCWISCGPIWLRMYKWYSFLWVFVCFYGYAWLSCVHMSATFLRWPSDSFTNASNFEQYSIVVPNFLFFFGCCVFLHYRRIRTLMKRVNMYFCYHTYAWISTRTFTYATRRRKLRTANSNKLTMNHTWCVVSFHQKDSNSKWTEPNW